MKRCLKIFVKGKVQGVYYRQSAKKMADDLGLSGWVKNENDGSVSIEAEGEDEMLNKFAAWCKRGSQHAEVEQVVVEEGIVQNHNGFEIKRF